MVEIVTINLLTPMSRLCVIRIISDNVELREHHTFPHSTSRSSEFYHIIINMICGLGSSQGWPVQCASSRSTLHLRTSLPVP